MCLVTQGILTIIQEAKGSTRVQIILIVDAADHKYGITTTPRNSIKLPLTTLKRMKWITITPCSIVQTNHFSSQHLPTVLLDVIYFVLFGVAETQKT